MEVVDFLEVEAAANPDAWDKTTFLLETFRGFVMLSTAGSDMAFSSAADNPSECFSRPCIRLTSAVPAVNG